MTAAALPSDEAARRRSLVKFDVLDSPPEREFDALVQVAAAVCQTPVALISLVDEHGQWFKASVGLRGVTERRHELAFCAHAILQDGVLEIPDAREDRRFADSTKTLGDLGLRFYAGATLKLSDGARVGTLCVADDKPRRLDEHQRGILVHLAHAVVNALEGRRAQLALRNERARVAAVIEATGAGTWQINVQTGVAIFNRRWAALLGHSLEELGPTTLKTWRSRVHPDDRDRFDTFFGSEPAEATRSPAFVFEMRMRQKDGGWIWVLCRGGVISRISGDRPEWIFGTQVDFSNHKAQEEVLRHSEQLLLRTGSVAGIGGWELDLESMRLTWSEQTYRIHGVGPDYQPQLDAAIEFFAPEVRPLVRSAVENGPIAGRDWDLELPLIQANGTRIWVRMVGNAEFDGGRPARFMGAIQDVTEQVQQRQALATAAELLKVTLQSIADAVITTDAAGAINWLNPVAERMTGWSTDEARGHVLIDVVRMINEETRLPVENPVFACLEQGKRVGLANHTLLISRQGDEFGIEDSAAPIRNEAGEILGVVLVFRDVSEQRRMSGEMSYRASHDALTGLLNRAEFEARLRRTLNRAHEDHSLHYLLFIDLDQFKIVNDACGHTAGDELLQQVSKLIGEDVRGGDTLARLGGDEFAVILEGCTAEQAERTAQRICDRVDAFRYLHDGRRFRIGTSIGLVPVDIRWNDTVGIVQAADASCYAAKEAGRNQVHVWRDSDHAMSLRRGEVQWAARLEQALDDDMFVLFAQRIQSMDGSDEGLHAEVLLRMVDSDGSLVLPAAFLPVAERFHLAARVDRWVLKHAVDQLLSRVELSTIAILSINLSGHSIGDRAFHRQAFEILSQAGNEVCRRICLEITETVAVTNLVDAVAFIEQVRSIGVRIALDDFGAGASSFSYLKNLRVDFLKIDGQYIRDLVEDPLDDATVRCFVDVARVVGLKTTAEFVDRPETLARVRAIGIDYAQGFFLHKPEPLLDVLCPVKAVTPAL